MLLAQRVGPGPAGDVSDLVPLAANAADVMPCDQLIAGAGYDSEANHRFCREELEIDSLICSQEAPLSHRGRQHAVPAGNGQAAGQARRPLQTVPPPPALERPDGDVRGQASLR
ncbi:MAG TPA: hypothetical protein VHL31_08650 [Geminicoccus sp.]|jgi:hypothetical protein|uniref:hypothetical protein n=1 Tax=Geminicoccus sp. TaxID=2024832 RepID=UPI002E31ABBD|nr:hypothetical protein [Geminicoccus sp.]HEX2526358.1 hypothetical protein [Geminicoccus sp.]